MREANIAAEAQTEITEDEKTYAGLAHALMITTWWIGPLIILLIRKNSRFVRFHALQAILWQIISTVLYSLSMITVFAVLLVSVLSASQKKTPDFPIGLFLMFPIFWLMMMGGFAISMILGIVYCLKAMRGEWAGYPLIGRWTRKIFGD